MIVKKDYYVRAKEDGARRFYRKRTFPNPYGKTPKKLNPFDLYDEHGGRRDIDDIISRPMAPFDDRVFNVWRGYAYKNTAGTAPSRKARFIRAAKIQPFLNHILYSWSNGNQKTLPTVKDCKVHSNDTANTTTTQRWRP